MDFYVRKSTESVSPWIRQPKPTPLSREDLIKLFDSNLKRKKFYAAHEKNRQLDVYVKRAALKASHSLVCLQSYIVNDELFQCSGTVIESEDDYSIILTSASLLRSSTAVEDIKIIVHLPDETSINGVTEAWDFHYNLAAIRIERSLPTALITHLNELYPSQLHEEKPFHLRTHQSRVYNLIPGDLVVALGRFVIEPYDLMAAPGEFCIDRCQFKDNFNCKELFKSSCRITRCGIGGPLVNRYAEVIGICFYDHLYTPFLPINVAILWWEHFKKHSQLRRPWLGIEATNLYTTDLDIIGEVNGMFPVVVKGVLVEEVIPGSSAASANIKCNDVIIEFGGKKVQSFLELFEIIWHKWGEVVKLTVVRPGDGAPLHLEMVVGEAKIENLYKWPLLKDIP